MSFDPLFQRADNGFTNSYFVISNQIVNLRRGTTTYFYLTWRSSLGTIIDVRLWHDNPDSGIKIEKLLVRDDKRDYW